MTMNLETELAQIVIARLTEQQALDILKQAGYRMTKARTPKSNKAERPTLNAIGKPYGANYDPNYKVKHKVRPAYVGSRQNVGPGISPAQWQDMCKLAQAQWNNTHKEADKAPLARGSLAIIRAVV